MKPTPQMAEQYCAALMAWAEGKRVEWRTYNSISTAGWLPVEEEFPKLSAHLPMEFRIIDEPLKVRDVLVKLNRYDVIAGCAWPPACSALMDGERWVRFREVSAAADAELADLRRNHDAMKTAILQWDCGRYLKNGLLGSLIEKHGVKL